MNERIQKLYIQVVGDDKLNFDSYLAEKFAELIVGECKKINSELLGHNTLTDLHNMYKDHFGVEE